MQEYKVSALQKVVLTVVVKANSEEEALEKAEKSIDWQVYDDAGEIHDLQIEDVYSQEPYTIKNGYKWPKGE